MDNPSTNLGQTFLMQCLIFWLATAIALGFAAVRGRLRPSVLALAPERHIKMGYTDLLIVVWGLLAGMLIAGLMMGPPEGALLPDAIYSLNTQLFNFMLPLGYIYYLLRQQPDGLTQFGLKRPSRQQIISGVLAFFIALPAVLAVSTTSLLIMIWMGSPIPKTGHVLLGLVADSHSNLGLAILSISVVFVAPFAEEILYRGVIQTYLVGVLGPSRRWLVLILSGLLFSSVHWGLVPWPMLPALFVLGVILGWLYETTGSLVPAMLVHGLFNAANVAMTVLSSWS